MKYILNGFLLLFCIVINSIGIDATYAQTTCLSTNTPTYPTTGSVLLTGSCIGISENTPIEYELSRFGASATGQVICMADGTRSYSSGNINPGIYDFTLLSAPICDIFIFNNPIEFAISTCQGGCSSCMLTGSDLSIGIPTINGSGASVTGMCNQAAISGLTGYLSWGGWPLEEMFIPCVNNMWSWSATGLAGDYILNIQPQTNCNHGLDLYVAMDGLSTCSGINCPPPVCEITQQSMTLTGSRNSNIITMGGTCNHQVLSGVQLQLSGLVVENNQIVYMTGLQYNIPCSTSNTWSYTGAYTTGGWMQYHAAGIATGSHCTGSVIQGGFLSNNVGQCQQGSILATPSSTLTCNPQESIELIFTGVQGLNVHRIRDLNIIATGNQLLVLSGGLYGVIGIGTGTVCVTNHIVYNPVCTFRCSGNQCIADSSGTYTNNTCNNQCGGTPGGGTPGGGTPGGGTPGGGNPGGGTPGGGTPGGGTPGGGTPGGGTPEVIRKSSMKRALEISHTQSIIELPLPLQLQDTGSHMTNTIVLILIVLSFGIAFKSMRFKVDE